MNDLPPERRSFIRVPFTTEVEIEVSDRTIRSQNSINISMNGLQVAADETGLAAGTPCSAKIILTASDSRLIIEAKGKVVRSEPGSLGIQFTELDIDSYQHLRRLILYNTEHPEKAEKEFGLHKGIKISRTRDD